MKYDILVVAIGSENNTFNTPGVEEHAHFLKELLDARRIRSAISDAFESAMIPSQTPEEIKRLLHFVVVGGGPTGVEFAAEVELQTYKKNNNNLNFSSSSQILFEKIYNIIFHV
jgi:NADH:ubiquinone reductase (non-electrogenic)